MPIPTCRKCGGQHFNFLPCDKAPAIHARLDRNRRNPTPIYKPLPEGEAEWGDRLQSFDQIAPNVFMNRKENE